MQNQWYKSKTKWGGILLALAQLLKAIPATESYASLLEAIGLGLGSFGVRDALAGQPPPVKTGGRPRKAKSAEKAP